jgi:FtsH-binding integral membrane protein
MGISYGAMTAPERTGAERATLVRRTYSLVLAGVVMTTLGCAWAMSQTGLMEMVARHPFLTFLATLAPLMGAQAFRNQFPLNIGLTLLFTLIEGVWIAPLVFVMERQQPGVASQAAILTLSTFGVLTAYAFISRRDFSAWGSFFVVGLWVLIGTSLLNVFFQNQTASLWIAGATVLVFSGMLVYDTWRLRNKYGPDDYVIAAVQIYLDLLNLFTALLRLLGGRRG